MNDVMIVDAFYSDPHFGHAKVIKYSGRPFRDAEHQTNELIKRYNKHIGSSGVVVWTGDCFFYKKDRAKEIMSQLNGSKLLVLGNHDRKPSAMAEIGFELVTDRLHMAIAGRRTLVCHYPFRYAKRLGDERYLDRYPEPKKGLALLHGHTHSKVRRNGMALHVGVDAWDYRPVLYDEVEFEVGQM